MPSFAPNGQTVSLVPQVVGNFGPLIQEDEVARTTVFVFATDHAGAQAYWEFRVMLRRQTGQTAQQTVGTSSQTVHVNTAGAATWTATVNIVAGDIQVTVTGALGVTADWLCTSDDVLGLRGPFAP